MSQQLYEKITDALVKEGYVVIENALGQVLCSSLLDKAKKLKNFRRAGISARKKISTTRRRDKIRWLDEDAGIQSEFLDLTQGLQEYLNRELFMGLSYFESHFAIYDKGDFYETHYDAFKDSKNRVVTVVYYLNEAWDHKSGGELMIYNEEENFVAKVLPEADTLVVFLSEKFPHEVVKTKRKRYSIAGWFRVDIKEGVPLPLETLA